MPRDFPLPPDLPAPKDDGGCDHLPGMHLPPLRLPATSGRMVDLGNLEAARTVLYCYPMTGVPGRELPEGWDAIPGARGCTPESCAFRDHHAGLEGLGAQVFGLSTQTSGYQKEMAARLHLPFEVLSDSYLRFCEALRLPTFTAGGMRLIKRLTLVVRGGTIETVFYPVFPPDTHASEVVSWLARRPL